MLTVSVEENFDAIVHFLTSPTVDSDDAYQPIECRWSLLRSDALQISQYPIAARWVTDP